MHHCEMAPSSGSQQSSLCSYTLYPKILDGPVVVPQYESPHSDHYRTFLKSSIHAAYRTLRVEYMHRKECSAKRAGIRAANALAQNCVMSPLNSVLAPIPSPDRNFRY